MSILIILTNIIYFLILFVNFIKKIIRWQNILKQEIAYAGKKFDYHCFRAVLDRELNTKMSIVNVPCLCVYVHKVGNDCDIMRTELRKNMLTCREWYESVRMRENRQKRKDITIPYKASHVLGAKKDFKMIRAGNESQLLIFRTKGKTIPFKEHSMNRRICWGKCTRKILCMFRFHDWQMRMFKKFKNRCALVMKQTCINDICSSNSREWNFSHLMASDLDNVT